MLKMNVDVIFNHTKWKCGDIWGEKISRSPDPAPVIPRPRRPVSK